jgi:hypothetical protein
MEKGKYLTFLFCLILCYSLFQLTARAQSSSQASSSSRVSISLQGRITYPPSNVNLAVIPDGFSLTFGTVAQYAFVDYTVFHYGTVSIRIDPTIPSASREIDGKWRNCKPGDHIVMRCWIKTGTPTNTDPLSGARIGIDLYAAAPQAGYVNIVDGHPHDGAEHLASVVRWGSDWTLKTWDFIVPSTFYTKDNAGNTIPAVQIKGFIPWLDARPSDWANSHAYFADAELYINPT